MPSGGFWKRPATRMYSYNLDLGEHYYSPMTTYLDTERGTRGETPGALTFSERLARKWVNGRRYEASELRDRYARSSSLAREASQVSSATAGERIWRPEAARAARAVSEIPQGQAQGSITSAWLNRRAMQEQASASSASAQSSQVAARSASVQQSSSQQQSSSVSMKSTKQESTCCEEVVQSESTKKMALLAKQKLEAERKSFLSGFSASSQQKKAVSAREEEAFKIRVSEKQSDDVCKKVADIHMQPWANRSDMQEAEEASARARARIAELERELEEITKKALMSSSKCLKTAKQMAYQASMEAEEEAKAMSSKKSKKVMIQSSTSIRG